MAFTLRSRVEPIDPSEVPYLVSEVTLTQCIQVAVVTVLAYDTSLTMDKEVRYFWKGPFRKVNLVYFANRYIGLFGAIAMLFWSIYGVNLALCNFANWSRSISGWFTEILIDYILMIRVLALYSKDRRLSICLKLLLLLEAIVRFGLLIYDALSPKGEKKWTQIFAKLKLVPVAVGGLTESVMICGSNAVPSWHLAILDWIFSTVYAVILLILALCKAANYWRMSTGFKGFFLVKVLIQDQILYFVLVLVCSIVNMAQLRIAVSNRFLALLLEMLGNPSFLCVLGSRLLVNLKEAGELGLNEGTNYRVSSRSVSEMEFVEGNAQATVSNNSV